MSSLKTNIKASDMNRSALNTTINADVLEEFKKACKTSCVPMNTCIETFMRQFNNGDFYLKFGTESKCNAENIENDNDNDNDRNINVKINDIGNISDNFGMITDE